MSWGPGAQEGFQNALAMGLQLGQVARQNQQQDLLMKQREQQIALQQREFDARLAAGAREADVKTRAAAGDPAAMAELAGIDFNAWRGLSADQQGMAKDGIDALGQAALFVAQQPPEARAAAWDQQVELLARRFPNVGQYRGQYSEQSLQSVIAQAGQFDQFWQITKPETFNVGPGEGRYQRDPRSGAISTVIEPNLGGAPAFSPVTTPKAEKTIGGQTYVQDANGDWYVKGGGGSDVTGNFPRP